MNCNAADPPAPGSAAGRVLVIGYGNTLRGDDAFGPVVADRLRSEAGSERVLILTCHQLTPELAADIAACAHVIFIDASIASPAGELVCRDLTAGEADAGPLLHSLGPGQLLDLARLVYGRAPSASLVCVGGLHFDLGDHQLSPPIAAAVAPAVERIRELIDRLNLSSRCPLPRPGA
jgi:hydrogenase maturation protease